METDFNPYNLTYGFIGLGLIGGSMAKALRQAFPDCSIIAFNRSEKPRIMAFSDGTANIVTDTINDSFALCDFIFLCTPVEFNETYLDKLSSLIKPGCIITDVGSVKGNIHKAVSERHMDSFFIGGHPMAGSEKTGYEYSDASLCHGAIYPVTPTSRNNKADIDNYLTIIKAMGFNPVIMTPEAHDKTAAAISHLPHLISAGLTLLVRDNETDEKYMRLLASTGFRDTTRIAASSPDVWRQICITNAENISAMLSQYISGLEDIKKAIDNKDKDAIEKLFKESKEYRDLF